MKGIPLGDEGSEMLLIDTGSPSYSWIYTKAIASSASLSEDSLMLLIDKGSLDTVLIYLEASAGSA